MLELQNNRYSFGGKFLDELGEKYGTPCYVYDANTIANQYRKMHEAFSGFPHRINYACKALNNQTILQCLNKLGAGLDTVSIMEVYLGLRASFRPDQIIFTPSGVAFSEIEEAVSAGVYINIDNLSVLEQFGQRFGGKVPVCIRLNPHIMAGGNSKISTGHIDSKFGISIHQLRHIQRVINHYHIDVTGLHMHTGSDILDSEVFLHSADILFQIALEFPNLQLIDFGSGFKVKYAPDDVETNLVELGQMLAHRYDQFCGEYGAKPQLWFEPGKYLVSEAGVLLVSVNVLKQTTSAVFAGVNSGLNHLIRPMFYSAYHHIINVSNSLGRERIYTVSGNICETDTFAWDRRINEIREGDMLAFANAGAYGFSMSSQYNARVRPPEVLLFNGADFLIRRREVLEDLVSTEVSLEDDIFNELLSVAPIN
jgi:diaminopimelate decarboxylase